MSDTPVCDENMHVTEQDYEVVPLCVARALERELNKLKAEKKMQTIPSNLNAEELLRWYDSTWNKLTNSEMEQRLAGALKKALDELDECNARENDLEAREFRLDDRESKLDEREDELDERE